MLEKITYPQNIKIEQAVLGALLINNQSYWKISSFLSAEHFREPVHQRIYFAIALKISQGHLVTPLVIKLEFDKDPSLADIGGSEYLARLVSSAITVLGIKSYAEELLALSRRRTLIDICLETLVDAQNVAIDRSVVDIESDILKSLSDLSSSSSGGDFENSKDVAIRVVENLKKPLNCYKTGIDKLDFATIGGLYARRMYSFSGRMKDGKSIWATTLAYNMAELGTKVFFLTLEMENEEIQTRFLARKMEVKPSLFFHARSNDDFQDRAAAAAVLYQQKYHHEVRTRHYFRQAKAAFALRRL